MSYKVNWTPDSEAMAIKMLTEYFEKHGTGEAIYQSDMAQTEGLEMLAEISDNVLGDEGIEWIDE